MILVVEAFVAALAGEPLVRFADDADGSRAELARLERRYLMGQQAGGDSGQPLNRADARARSRMRRRIVGRVLSR